MQDLQYLFTYGTLKSDQPEHAWHCAPPRSIEPARAAGSLWKLREGYPILEIDPERSLLDATADTEADWRQAAEAARRSSPPAAGGHWAQGELFAYPLDSEVLSRMDEWENFVPGVKSVYQRRVIWVKDADDRDRIAWAYVCYSPPDWATMIPGNVWNPPS